MNSLPTENVIQINGLFIVKAARNAAIAAALVSAFSGSAFASQPATEENRPAMSSTETPAPSEPIAIQTRPQAEEPSAVEVMMQQQNQQQSGDIVRLPAKEIQPGETIKIKLLDLPRRGTSMEKVQQELGSPTTKSDSVGKPPITSWTYNDRIVYFEYSTVLHVVAR